MAFLLVFLCFIVTYLVYYGYFYNKKQRDASRNLPGPTCYPFLGSGLTFAFSKPEDYLKRFEELISTYGKRIRMFIGLEYLLVLTDPKDVQVVMTSPDFTAKSTEYRFFLPWLGTGLLLSSGEKWFKHRKALTPGFHFTILDEFVKIFDKQTNILIEKLKHKADGNPFDIYPIVNYCALDIICETAMGISLNSQNNDGSEYVKAVHSVCTIINWRMRSVFERPDLLFNLTKKCKAQKESLKLLHDFTDKVILQRKEWLKSNSMTLSSLTEETNNDVFGKKKRMALMDILLLTQIDGKPIPDLEIREEVDTFMFEGHDTVSSALAFTLYLLSKHPDVQEKVYMEQIELFPNNESTPLVQSDLQNNMKYLDMVIKESLRMYPSVPAIGRIASKDSYINDIKVPKDTSVVVSLIYMQKDPEYFPEPEKFIPERFLPSEINKRHTYATIPFSAGSRNCIGQKFAMMEIKCIISKIVRNFKLTDSNEDVTLAGDLILKSMNGINVKMTKRSV